MAKLPLLVPLLLLVVAGGCSSGGDDGGVSTAFVSGRVMDDIGMPVAGALVEASSEPVSTTTDANGRFLLQMEPGSHQMTVSAKGLMLCEACFTLRAGETHHLGDMYPGHHSECGDPMPCLYDTDCDGISDQDELRGWEVRVVSGDGVTEVVALCTSDPTLQDTDGDGLHDLEELAARTDPRRRDTDGDLLPDFAELNAYKSNPCMVDSDGDSRGPEGTAISDPNLWDGFELVYLRTSPTMDDTDGDGLTDWEEIHSGGTNPRIADLPTMSLDLHGDPTLILDITEGSTVSELSSTLERDSDSYEKTDTEATKMSIENTVGIHSEFKGGTSTWPPSFNVKITTDTLFKHGYFTESMASWTEASVRESQGLYEARKDSVTSWDDGRLAVAVKVTNSSDLSFKVKDLRITAYRQAAGGSFSPVGNLVPGQGFITVDGKKRWNAYPDYEFVLGPSAEVTLLVGADGLPTQIMRALVANPTALLFEVGSYSLFQLDELGVRETVNFAKLGEDVIQRTGLIVIDFGNGAIERYMVATNVFRYPDGSGRGLTLGDALGDVIGIDHESELATSTTGDNRRVLTRVRTRSYYGNEEERDEPHGFWIVGGTSPAFDEPLEIDFEDIVLRAGERLNLTFVEDRDGEGLFDREEYLLGTNVLERDTDGDGLDDFQEAKTGWEVAVRGRTPYWVYPDPRFFDYDGDYLSDSSEEHLGTDPYLRSTDGDEYDDAFDSDPLAAPCLAGGPLDLSAWWDGTVSEPGSVTALDAWVDDLYSSDAVLSDPAIAHVLLDEPVFRLNPGVSQRDQYLEAPGERLSPQHEYTVAAWVQWQGELVGEEWHTLLAKGHLLSPFLYPTYALFVSRDGVLQHGLFRVVITEARGYPYPQWTVVDEKLDWATQDSPSGTIPKGKGEWVHVAATFANDWMRLYVNGVQLEPRQTWARWSQGGIEFYEHTKNLVPNSDLRIGGDPSNTRGPFRGFLDDVQYFHRALGPEEIEQLYLLGVCGSDS